MNYQGPSIAEIKSGIYGRRTEFLRWLKIDGDPDGSGTLLISAPMRKDRNPSFVIWLKNGSIAWKDMATGECGDDLNLIDYMHGLPRPPRGCTADAFKLAKEFLGFNRMTEDERRELAKKSQARIHVEKKKSAEDLARKQGDALKMFIDAKPFRDTLAHTYLRMRTGGLIDTLPKGPRGGERLPGALRFEARAKHIWQGKKDDPRNGEESYWPMMIACCIDPIAWRIDAVHRTWLALDGSGKAPVAPPRKCFPDVRGLIIPIWRGDSGMSVKDANDCGLRETWQGGEGIEKSIALAILQPKHRTFAFISLSNLGNIQLPPSCDGLLIHRDNEWENGEAAKAFERGRAALERQGRPVEEFSAVGGVKDLDDALRGDE